MSRNPHNYLHWLRHVIIFEYWTSKGVIFFVSKFALTLFTCGASFKIRYFGWILGRGGWVLVCKSPTQAFSKLTGLLMLQDQTPNILYIRHPNIFMILLHFQGSFNTQERGYVGGGWCCITRSLCFDMRCILVLVFLNFTLLCPK